MEENIKNNSEILGKSNLQHSLTATLQKNWVKTGLVILTGLILLTGVFYVGVKVVSNKEVSKSSQPIPQETSFPSVTPTVTPSSQQIIKPVTDKKTLVTSPEKFGFTKIIEFKAIGVKAKLPEESKISLEGDKYYTVQLGNEADISLELADYNGIGRRKWFVEKNPFYSNYFFDSFTGLNHRGYIAHQKEINSSNPGVFFYFSAVSQNQILQVRGLNNIYSGDVDLFNGSLDKFKSFLSTVELVSSEDVVLEVLQTSDLYQWSSNRRTVWEDSNLSLKITVPEWTESRYTRGRDADGKYTYTEWARTYPEAITHDGSYLSENVKRVEVTGGYISGQWLTILLAKYQDKSFSDVTNELLLPAGFCTSEWKNSKTDCTGPDFCYTRDEVVQNLIVKKQIKIGTLDAQLRSMNQDFSDKNDCRSEDTWLIKAKNGQFILSNISPDSESIRVEAL